MTSIWGEMKRRNVVRVAIAYAIASWLILQLANILVPLLALPAWVDRFVLLILLLGFPLAMFFAWAFELTPEGLKKEKDVDRTESVTNVSGRKLDFIIIAVLAAALIFFVSKEYVLTPDVEPKADVTQEIATTDIQQSIAVLPFVNMSSDPEQEYFSDGLSEEILNLLAKVPDLRVIGRTSSFAFKGKNEDLRVIGKALDVRTVLEGSVRKSGDRVRITAQLIDVSDGGHLWSETYDRTLTDIFAVQDNVAEEILDALQIHVGEAPTRGRPTENAEAYAFFLKAKSKMNAWDAQSAEAFLLQAVELDPDFAEAWEMLAYSYWEQWGNTLDGAQAQPRTADAASRALAIDPDLDLARVFLGTATLISDASNSFYLIDEITQLERILSDEPNNAVAAEMLTWDLQFAGYFRRALRLARRSVERDPLAPNAQINLATALIASGRRTEGITELELADDLGAFNAKMTLAYFHRLEQNIDRSITYEEAHLQERELPHDWVRSFHEGVSHPTTGQAYLDNRIPEIVASVPENRQFEMQMELELWYLKYGFLDRYFDLMQERVEAEIHMSWGIGDRSTGFTAHPRFLEIAEESGYFDLWEHHGPPDYCEKLDGQWVCE